MNKRLGFIAKLHNLSCFLLIRNWFLAGRYLRASAVCFLPRSLDATEKRNWNRSPFTWWLPVSGFHHQRAGIAVSGSWFPNLIIFVEVHWQSYPVKCIWNSYIGICSKMKTVVKLQAFSCFTKPTYICTS